MTEGRSSSRILAVPSHAQVSRRRRMLALAVLTVASLAGITGAYLHKNPCCRIGLQLVIVQVTSSATFTRSDTELLNPSSAERRHTLQQSIEVRSS
jgi:hypothetical protein